MKKKAIKEKQGSKKDNLQKTKSEQSDINVTISMKVLNVNRLNNPSKRQKCSHAIEKSKIHIYMLSRDTFFIQIYKEIERKIIEKKYRANSNHKEA